MREKTRGNKKGPELKKKKMCHESRVKAKEER